jgi:hypothetical protein
MGNYLQVTMWQLDFAVLALTILLTVIVGRGQQWPMGFTIWLGVILQPVGCLIAQRIYLSTSLSYASFMVARPLLSGIVPLATALGLAALSRKASRARSEPSRRGRLRVSIFELVVLPSMAVALFWYLYPLDFYSPHDFELPYIASLYDTYSLSGFDGSTVTNGHIQETYLVLTPRTLLRRKSLPITALAALFMFATAALGVVVIVGSLARNGGTQWYALDRHVRRSLLFAACSMPLFILIPLTLVATGLVPEQMIPWTRVVVGVLFLMSIPAAVWAFRQIGR